MYLYMYIATYLYLSLYMCVCVIVCVCVCPRKGCVWRMQQAVLLTVGLQLLHTLLHAPHTYPCCTPMLHSTVAQSLKTLGAASLMHLVRRQAAWGASAPLPFANSAAAPLLYTLITRRGCRRPVTYVLHTPVPRGAQGVCGRVRGAGFVDRPTYTYSQSQTLPHKNVLAHA